MTALDDAEDFLHRHPTFTTDVDNPVEILADFTREASELRIEADTAEQARLEAVRELRAAKHSATADRLTAAAKIIAELTALFRKLNSERKISDFELREALAIAKRTPDHLATYAGDPRDWEVSP